jgi:hypothetical protein
MPTTIIIVAAKAIQPDQIELRGRVAMVPSEQVRFRESDAPWSRREPHGASPVADEQT